MKFLDQFLIFLHGNHWIAQILIVLLVTLIANRSLNKLLRKLKEKFRQTKNIWDITVIKSIQNPISFLVAILGTTFSLQIINKQYDITLLNAASTVRDLAILGAVSWFSARFIKEAQKAIIVKKLKSHERIDRATIDAVSTIALILVMVVTGLMTLQTLGFNIGGILALGGVGGIAIGFAAKDLLSNFFGGLMIYFDRPFQIGDWIRSPDKEIEGNVVKIGWRQTQIKTFDHRPLYIPNSVFSSIVVENPSRMTNRRIYEYIGIRYEDVDKLEIIIQEVKEMLIASDEIDNNKTMIVNVNSFGASSIDFFIYTSTVTTNWIHFHKVKQDILLNAANIIAKHGAEIAFPTSTIHLASDARNNPAKLGE